jgi:hypothetical protein
VAILVLKTIIVQISITEYGTIFQNAALKKCYPVDLQLKPWNLSLKMEYNVINPEDYTTNETQWMAKIDKAWFRGSMNGVTKGRVSILNETLSFPEL